MKLLPTMAGVPHVHSHYRKRKEVPAAEKAPGGQIRRQSAQIHRVFQGKLRPITEIPPEPGGIYFGKRAGSHRQVLLGKVVVKFAYRPLRNDGALLEDYKILGYPLGTQSLQIRPALCWLRWPLYTDTFSKTTYLRQIRTSFPVKSVVITVIRIISETISPPACCISSFSVSHRSDWAFRCRIALVQPAAE